MVRIVCITAALIFNESEPKTRCCTARGGNVATDKSTIAVRYNVRPVLCDSRARMEERAIYKT